jgi:regulator of replication initiation timing
MTLLNEESIPRKRITLEEKLEALLKRREELLKIIKESTEYTKILELEMYKLQEELGMNKHKDHLYGERCC